jgi:two-component system, sensor histidine kinase and response regulator
MPGASRNPLDLMALGPFLEPDVRMASVKPITSDSPEVLMGIPGLDVRGGLHRCLDRWGLYRGMLVQFAAQQDEADARLRQALDARDWPTAQRLAHTLKGVAGTLGARDVQDLATDLDAALRGRDLQHPPDANQIALLHERLDEGVQFLLLALRRALPAASPTQPLKGVEAGAQTDGAEGGAVVPAEARRLARTLIERLMRGDPSAVGWAAEHATTLSALLGDDHPAIAKAIREFDFEHAIATLRRHLPEPTGATVSGKFA